MEGTEEVLEYVGSSNNEASVTQILKGKRTKRQRPFSPCAVVAGMTSSSSSASADHEHVSGAADYGSISSTTTTDQNNYDISTEEEEDMANCLILLAQGRDANAIAHQNRNHSHGTSGGGGIIKAPERGATRRFAEMATATAAKIGFYVYECKTCNRTFPSFQALGGHRASHKKPKLAVEEKKPSPPPSSSPPPPPISSQLINNFELEEGQLKISSQISVQLGNNNNGVLQQSNKAKIHECSICGSEFTSGQALGGHMRRHRASTTASCNATATGTVPEVVVKPRNILALDLNLPAPEEDLRESKYHQFTPKQKPNLVLPAPSLVDCHY